MFNSKILLIAFVLALSFCLTAAFAEGFKSFMDIAYYQAEGFEASATSLDIYAPEAAKGLPVVVWVHGGGWSVGDKKSGGRKAQPFTAEGFVLVSVNYRMRPKVDIATLPADVARSLAWVHANIKNYGGDPGRVFLMGHSAGAHLVALVATDESYLAAQGLDLGFIKGVVALDGGGYDIKRQVTELGNAQNQKLYRVMFGEDEAGWDRMSPIAHVAPGKKIPPHLIIYVASRRDTPIGSAAYAAKLAEAGVTARAIGAKNKTHATLNRALGEAGDEPTAWVFEFLKGLSTQK